jgi:hypothetical protein
MLKLNCIYVTERVKPKKSTRIFITCVDNKVLSVQLEH